MVERVDYSSEEEFIQAQVVELEQEIEHQKKEYYRTQLAYIDYLNEQSKFSLVFQSLCRHACCIFGGWAPYPTRCMAESTSLSMYKTRKELHRLRDLGLVEVARHCEVTEEGNYLMTGWVVTQQGMKTETYKQMDEEEAQRVRESFNFNMKDE